MGQINGKSIQSQKGEYFQQQIELYRWRADSAFNLHIPRVRFFSKKTILHRSQFQNLLSEQLSNFNFVDVSSISRLNEENQCKEEEEIMTFQPFATTLDAFSESLTLQESLYVLQALLSGYQTIFLKLRGFFVSAECCFVNEKGQVRAWINRNYTLNEFAQNYSETSQATAVNQILRLCATLNSNQASFLHFSRQLRLFFDRDMLQNLSFSAARRFINGYLFTHKLILPSDLSQSLKRLEAKTSSRHSVRRDSSLSELLEPAYNSNSYLSTKDNLMNRQPSRSQYSPVQSSSCLTQKNQESQLSKAQHIQFYRPTQPPLRKCSNLELNMSHCNNSVNKSELLLKRSVQQSISSTFSKKHNVPTCQITFTPKNAVKTRAHLYSTAEQSFLRHSKDTNGLAVSKIVQSNSTAHLLEYSQIKPRLQKRANIKNVGFIFNESNKDSRKIQKMQTQAHSKQPSFDQNSSSLFVSPHNEQADRNYFSRPVRSKIDTVSESEQADEEESEIQQDISTIGQVFPSQLNLGVRQVSGLIENKDLHLCESKGSFLSIQNNSCASEYRGELLRMGRSAKMVALPSNKRLQGYARSNIEPHFTR